jgi:hypothetical protein
MQRRYPKGVEIASGSTVAQKGPAETNIVMPLSATFFVYRNSDSELPCFFCGKTFCSDKFVVHAGAEEREHGCHRACLDQHHERQCGTFTITRSG